MLDRNGKYIQPLAELVRTMRSRPHFKGLHSGKRLLRREIEAEYRPTNAVRWSGRQWTKFRKFLARQERATP